MVPSYGKFRVVERSPDRPTSPTAGLPDSGLETFGQQRGRVRRPAHNMVGSYARQSVDEAAARPTTLWRAYLEYDPGLPVLPTSSHEKTR